jgi:outer membrane protein OmpA-like peptidoglycan-associated protein
MKASSGLFGIVLVFWMSGSTYWYVCKIKNHCKAEISTVQPESNSVKGDDTLSGNTGNKNQIITKEDIVNDVKNKISGGYVVYNFPKNSTKHNLEEESFTLFAEDLKLYLDENPSEAVQIIGHTDDVGTNEGNVYFGKKRAEYIKMKLTEKGIRPEQMEIVSKGETEPAYPNDNEENRQKNRRVVIQSVQK